MWQRQRGQARAIGVKKIEICVSAPTAAWHGLAWCGTAWHGVAWRAMAATADCPSHCYCGWVNVSRCVRVYLFVCLWVASFAHFNANVGLPGSGVCRRHSLSAFAFAVASRVRARVACSFWDFGSSLCGGKEGRLRVGAASYWMPACVRWCGCWNFYCRLRQYAAAAATTSRAIETTITDT